jgi:aspartate kinase
MFGEAGFLSEVFAVCARHGVIVDLVTTSEVSISLTANEQEPLEGAARELCKLGDVTLSSGRTVLAVVGQHLVTRVGLGADILRAVAHAGVNIEMISYAAGSINLSIVIADAEVARAVAVLHRILFEHEHD